MTRHQVTLTTRQAHALGVAASIVVNAGSTILDLPAAQVTAADRELISQLVVHGIMIESGGRLIFDPDLVDALGLVMQHVLKRSDPTDLAKMRRALVEEWSMVSQGLH